MSVTSARDRPPTENRSDRVPLWVTGVTVALLALGFSRSRIPHPAASNPTSHDRESNGLTILTAVIVGLGVVVGFLNYLK
jgi:hypothetical protein